MIDSASAAHDESGLADTGMRFEVEKNGGISHGGIHFGSKLKGTVSNLNPSDNLNVVFTMASENKNLIEKVCADFYSFAKLKIPNMKGVSRHPTKRAVITTRRSPCGEGTNSWNRYRYNVHVRSFSISSPSEIFDELVAFLKGSKVRVTIEFKQ